MPTQWADSGGRAETYFSSISNPLQPTNLLLDAMSCHFEDSKVADMSIFQMEVNWQGRDFAKNTIGLTGGEGRSVLFLDNDAKSFDTSAPSLIHDRYDAGCAVFKSAAHNLRPVVLAVGGTDQATAEVLDITQPNANWTESKIRSTLSF